MRMKPFGMVALTAGAAICLAPPAQADLVAMAPHERTYQSLFGSFTVGNRDEVINRIAPLNQMGTTRESLVNSAAYGRIDGMAGGVLKTGYHVGCAVSIGIGTLGVTSAEPLGLNPDNPTFSVDPGPLATINLTPGEVREVPVAEKDLAPGITGTIMIRDFHLVVNTCTGPVSIRQYTYLYAKSAEVDDSGAVFGDPTWL
ncbi:MspA family porin [Nocardia sp. NPDC057668]|uniref:MspA family porin n=1 Tax=Nocardia sp. NPDC057668 TaxID=3346202 RepID=UPI0036717726